mgnify:FL=1
MNNKPIIIAVLCLCSLAIGVSFWIGGMITGAVSIIAIAFLGLFTGKMMGGGIN